MEAPALRTQLDANSFAYPGPLNFTPDALPDTMVPICLALGQAQEYAALGLHT